MRRMLVIIKHKPAFIWIEVDEGNAITIKAEGQTLYHIREKEDLVIVYNDFDFYSGKEYNLPSTNTVIFVLWKSSDTILSPILEDAKKHYLKDIKP